MPDVATRIRDLLRQYHTGEISSAELEELNAWRSGSPKNEAAFQELTDPREIQKELQQWHAFEKHQDAVLEKIMHHGQKPADVIQMKRRKWIAVAAAVLLIVSVVYISNDARSERSAYEAVNKLPANNKATLTLYNGKSIRLERQPVGTVDEQENGRVLKPRNGEIVFEVSGPLGTEQVNILETPAGGQHVITLEDGTKVFLNALSQLRFPTKFTSDKREVLFSGEGYFEVAKDSKRPFTVIVNGQEVKVTGTRFTINAYNDEPYTRTTVIEGSVNIKKTSAPDSSIDVKPGQALKYDPLHHRFKFIAQADTVAARAFIDGDFIMNGFTVSEIMRQLSRWYDVEVEYAAGYDPEEMTVSGTFAKSQTLPGIIKILKRLHINARIEQDKLLVDYPN